MFYCLFCSFCSVDSASVHSGGGDKHAGSRFSSYCLSGCAADFGEFSDQLYSSGHGERDAVRNPYIQQTGAPQYSAADLDGSYDWSVWYDMDSACGGGYHASGVLRHVPAYAE